MGRKFYKVGRAGFAPAVFLMLGLYRPLPSLLGISAVNTPCRIRTYTTQNLNLLPLPIGLKGQNKMLFVEVGFEPTYVSFTDL